MCGEGLSVYVWEELSVGCLEVGGGLGVECARQGLHCYTGLCGVVWCEAGFALLHWAVWCGVRQGLHCYTGLCGVV